MCFHKALVEEFATLIDYYSASFQTITSEMELIQERFAALSMRDEKIAPYTKYEMEFLRWCDNVMTGFTKSGVRRYHENGFDYLPMPIITAGAPEQFKLFRWGLIPFFMTDKEKAFALRTSTLNCISEEMYEKPSFKDAARNHQRCLIPVSGFYEWRWMDDKGKEKIPYYIQAKAQPLVSMAGIYSRWKDKETDQYYYSYAVLTTRANSLMEEIHNSKKRMPVIIPRQYERDWLGKNLTKDDVLDLCKPIDSDLMKAHTISKLISRKGVDTNVAAINEAQEYDISGKWSLF